MSVRPLKRQRPVSPYGLPLKKPRQSQWEEILRVWTKLEQMPPLVDSSGRRSSRFVVEANTPTEVVVNVKQIKSMGLNSQIFAIHLDDKEAPVILKKHTPADENNAAPEIEAELQKWAHKHGLAPEVKAYNSSAMIIEKCSQPLAEEPLVQGYKYMRGLSAKRFVVNTLNTALGAGSMHVFQFILKMYDTCGLYNRDPNFDNYMYLRGDLKQIDYGQNRFDNVTQFNAWFKQLPSSLRRNKRTLQQHLVVNDSAFPPLFQWYEVHVGTEADKKRDWERGQWVTSILAMKQQRQVLLHQLEQERQALLAPAESMRPILHF